MPNTILHVVEPKRLLLTWQSIDDSAERRRFAVGELMKGPLPTFRYYADHEFQEVNGRPLSYVRSIGYLQYPAFNRDRELHHDGVIEAFMRRLPPRDRRDFSEYKQHFRIAPDTKLSDFALLALTEAKLPGDGFSLVDPLDETASRREIMIEVAGYRHYAESCGVEASVGSVVGFAPEPSNTHDKNAIKVTLSGCTIGYINRFQCSSFHVWVQEHRLEAVIERVNGRVGHPRVYAFVKVQAAKDAAAA